MRLDAIRTFVTLVQTGSYAAAAEALFLSTTTAHGHVKSLEEELKATLVSFSNRRLELTQAGSRFFVFAERTLEEYAQTEEEISGLARQNVAHLRIVSLHGPSTHLLPPVVRAFRIEHPEAVVTVLARGVGESLAALVSGEADLAVLNDLHLDSATGIFGASDLYEDALALVIRADHYEPPDLALLERYPLAMQPSGSAYRQYVQRWARREGIAIDAAYEHTSFDGILSYVMAGGCIGMMAAYVPRFSPMADQLRVLDLPGFALQRKVIAVHPIRPDWLSAEFIGFFQRFYGTSTDDGPSAISE
jgi:DNA-binding transcriptional LysR family regulator